MAVYDLEEQEQLAELKAWWAQYGWIVTAVAVIAAVASVSWQGWQWYQRKQTAEAAALYSVVQKAVVDSDAAAARQAAGQILENYSSTVYAPLAALMSAKVQQAAGDTGNAALPLEWVTKNADEPVMRDIARLRLAAVRLDAGDTAAALALLADEPSAALKVRHYDLRGDALVADGKVDEARTAYQTALDAANAVIVPGDRSAEIIRIKLDALLGGAR
ncbi:MAG: hypothetical protein DWQ11_03310 [Proteobacteria bacterium]|nr:MAG: hypothetical protein DWQ11_03310 [Pseudomonadota bacterium]